MKSHKQTLKMRVYSAAEIANMVPWEGQYVPVTDVMALLEIIPENLDLEGTFDIELGSGDGRKEEN